MSQLKLLPDTINGFKIISDLGIVSKNRKCIAECMICLHQFPVWVSDLRRMKSCRCITNLDIDNFIKKRLIKIYGGMKQRCDNPRSSDYSRYGARGIKICDQWLKSYFFVIWAINNGYENNLTLDRIDNEKGYSPDNCRWATKQTQGQNVRHTILNPSLVKLIKIDLQTMTGVDVALKYGFTEQLISTIKTGQCWSNIRVVEPW